MSMPYTVTPPKKRRGSVIAGTVMVVVGAILGIVCFVLIAGAFSPLLSPESFQIPGSTTKSLEANEVYNVYTTTESPTIGIEAVRVFDPAGNPVRVTFPSPSDDSPLSTQSGTFVAQVAFRSSAAGAYRVEVDSPRTGRAMVGLSLTSLASRFALPGLGLLLAGILVVVGVIVLIVGAVRRSRANRPGRPAPSGYGPPGASPPSGFGPPPGYGPQGFGPPPGYGPSGGASNGAGNGAGNGTSSPTPSSPGTASDRPSPSGWTMPGPKVPFPPPKVDEPADRPITDGQAADKASGDRPPADEGPVGPPPNASWPSNPDQAPSGDDDPPPDPWQRARDRGT